MRTETGTSIATRAGAQGASPDIITIGCIVLLVMLGLSDLLAVVGPK